MWTRLVNSRREMTPITLKEKVNTTALKILLDMNRDHPAIHDKYAEIESYLKKARANDGILSVKYEQKALGVEDMLYDGSTKIGRFYPTISNATFLPKAVVSTMWNDSMKELDIVKSYSTFMVNVFSSSNLRGLETYCTDERGMPGLSAAEVKKVINVMICSYPDYPEYFGLNIGDEDKRRDILASHLYDDINRDLEIATEALKTQYWGLMQVMAKKVEGNDKSLPGKCFAQLASDAEACVMRGIITYLQDHGMEHATWKYDGLIVPTSLFNGEVTVSEIEDDIKTRHGMKVKLALKSLGAGIALAVSDTELKELDAYEKWKNDFEKKFFRINDPPMLCNISLSGNIQDLTDTQFKILTMDTDQEMLKRWKADPSKRSYTAKAFRPPPLACNDKYFNLWPGIAAADLPENEDEVSIEPYLRHTYLLSGEDQESADYIHKLIAYKIQNPGYQWRVMVFIRSPQGTGKDIWFKFLCDVIGVSNTARLARVSDVLEKSSHLIEGKVLVCFSEMCATDTNKFMEELKDVITNNQVIVKKKYVAEYKINSSACFIGFSNNYNAIRISRDDRRFFCVTASGRHANDPTYHVPVVEWFGQEKNQRAVYDHYMQMDLTGFDPSDPSHKPTTETIVEMMDDSINIGEVVMKKYWHAWIQQARASEGRRGFNDVKFQDGIWLLVRNSIIRDAFTTVANDLGWEGTSSGTKMDIISRRNISEISSKIEKLGFKRPIDSFVSNSIRYKRFKIAECAKYVVDDLKVHGEEGEDDNSGYAEGFIP